MCIQSFCGICSWIWTIFDFVFNSVDNFQPKSGTFLGFKLYFVILPNWFGIGRCGMILSAGITYLTSEICTIFVFFPFLAFIFKIST